MLGNMTVVPVALTMSSETLSMLWQTPLLGMMMIFAVLSCLWGILTIFKYVFAEKQPKEKREAPAAKVNEPTPAAAQAPATPTVETTRAVQNDAELIAVITAAVAAYREAEGMTCDGGFRVVSFRRVSNARPWNHK